MSELTPIRGTIKYIAELFKKNETDFDPRLATSPNNIDRSYNIYAFSVAALITDSTNYWIVWGGYFDNPVGYGLQIFLNRFLVEVFILSNLLSTENSFYVDQNNDIVYMNIPRKPWQYFSAYATLYNNFNSTFSSAPKNANNASDVYYGTVKTIPRMKVPSFDNKLNDIISGITVYNDFQISIFNHDGEFDGLDIIEYFNTPIQISKGNGDLTSIEDFNRIRYGLIQDIDVSFDTLQIKGVDQFYLMNKDFCKKFTIDDYPNIPDDNINNDIPVAWGDVIGISVFEINRDSADPCTWIEYIAIDRDYITAVDAVYDENGNELTFSFDSDTGIIRVTELDDDGEAIESESADVTGKIDSRLGKIIIEALEENENIAYVTGIWDIDETDDYLDICPDLGFYFDGGITRDLIEDVLKNDNAFLIQKNNGLLTLRRWGETYNVHTIPTYLTTQKPKKNFNDASKYFCSTIKIKSQKNYVNDNYLSIYIDDSLESSIFETYRRSFTAEFETDILNESDIEDLAERLLDRFGNVRETIIIGLGVDTFQINLLDTILYEAWINDDRSFSEYTEWIVKECDPGQDTLTMEGTGIRYLLSFDGDYATMQQSFFELTDAS